MPEGRWLAETWKAALEAERLEIARLYAGAEMEISINLVAARMAQIASYALDQLLALLLAEAHPQVLEKKEDTTRMDRLSTSSNASRTAAPDVAEGDRQMTPTQVNNEVERLRLDLDAHRVYARSLNDRIDEVERDNEVYGDYLGKLEGIVSGTGSTGHISWDLDERVRKLVADASGGNQQPSGLRGDPGAPRTMNADARDKESSNSDLPPPVTPTEDQT